MRRKDTPTSKASVLLPIFAVVLIGLAVGVARGGRLATLARTRLRLVPLVFVGLALQAGAIFGSRGTALALTIAASAAVLGFAALNVRRRGMLLVAVGAAMNIAVISANGGMPMSSHALDRAGLDDLFQSERTPTVHYVAGPGTRLRFLGDVIPIPPPVGLVASPGDAVIWAGLLLVVQNLMLPHGRRRVERGRDFPALVGSDD